MKRPFLIFLAIIFTLSLASAQNPGGSKLLIVMPFENASAAPGLDWIGESFPEVLGSRMGAPGLYVLPRTDRLYAFDRMGIPPTSHPSRATLYQIADQMDVDYVVTGKYLFDGNIFTARAQIIDVRRIRLSPEVVETGSLTQLLDVQNSLAWDLLRALNVAPGTKEAFVRVASPVRLDALENYIRGVIATGPADKVRFFRQAVKVNPDYADAQFLLGRTYFEQRDYADAIASLARVPQTSIIANEANFYLGLAAHYTGNYERAEQAFGFTASHVPLIEVYNNLGVAMARRGKRSAADYFQRAAAADPRDPDYHFNLGAALYRNGDLAAAQKQLREALALRPQDAEAKSFLDQLTTATANAAATKPPLERIKRNYDEASYRQVAIEIQNARELRFADMPGPQHAAAHVARGNDLLARSLPDEAEGEFREAVLLDPTQPDAHLGLARIYDSRNELAAARAEAQAALQLKATADSYLLLAGLDVKQNRLDAARENVARAERLEPDHPGIAVMRRAIAARAERPATESQP